MKFKNAPAGWKIKSTKNVYSNYYLKVYEDMLDLDGYDKMYFRVKRRNYSTIVPFLSDSEILIIKSYRHIVDSVQVEVPSGYVDKGETPKQAAARELKEETGCTARKIVPVGSYALDYSMLEQKGNMFVAYGLSKKAKQSLGRMEKIELDIITIKEAKKLLATGKILNAASIVALYRAIDFHERLLDAARAQIS